MTGALFNRKEYWPGVPADTVAALENLTTQSLAAEVADRRRRGMLVSVNARRRDLLEVSEFLTEHATDADYADRRSVKLLNDRIVKALGCNKYIAAQGTTIDRKRRGLD